MDLDNYNNIKNYLETLTMPENWSPIGPLSITIQENHYIAVAVNYLTKWPEAKVIQRADAKSVENFIYEDIICRHGCPIELLSD
ncbi:hypothetical protein G9A89_019330 [Geosiphon pyriformis]|nr:hypothetical protein G9A89_019330 [Geosiphon pyriformis]